MAPAPDHADGERRHGRRRAVEAEAPRHALEYPNGLEWLSATARRGNSNNWVLAGAQDEATAVRCSPTIRICRSSFRRSGTRCTSSRPDLDVIGVTIPGVPFVALGHNARIAWGMTDTGADVQDLALERVDVGKKRAMYRGEWVPIEVTQADIPVRGRSQPLPFEVWKTRNGPIFADVELDFERAAVVAVARRPSERGTARLFVTLGCQRRSGDGLRGDQSRHRLDVVHGGRRVVLACRR